LIAVVVALAIISSAITLNSGIQATIDQSDGVSMTQPEGMDLAEDINQDLQTSIIKSNRDSSIDFRNDLFDQQNRNFSEVVEYHGYQTNITIKEEIGGDRLYNDTGSELTSNGNNDWTVVNNPDLLTGGIELDADTISNADGPFHIDTTTHDIYITTGSGETVEARVDSGGTTRTYVANSTVRPYPYIDLGEGTFAGYRFEGYDQTDINRIDINNGTAAQGNIELVVTGYGTRSNTLDAESAIFGVVYSAEVHTGQQTLVTDDIATHGPLRGDF